MLKLLTKYTNLAQAVTLPTLEVAATGIITTFIRCFQYILDLAAFNDLSKFDTRTLANTKGVASGRSHDYALRWGESQKVR